jgi:hypothetical protein
MTSPYKMTRRRLGAISDPVAWRVRRAGPALGWRGAQGFQSQPEVERAQDEKQLLDLRGGVARLEAGQPRPGDAGTLGECGLGHAASFPLGADGRAELARVSDARHVGSLLVHVHRHPELSSFVDKSASRQRARSDL